MKEATVGFSIEEPFSPGWNANSKTRQLKSTPSTKSFEISHTPTLLHPTPNERNTSPKSEFGYDDAYSLGDSFVEVNIRKPKRRLTMYKKTPKKSSQFGLVKKNSNTKRKVNAQPVPLVINKPLTTPISPNFRIDKRMQNLHKTQLTTEDILIKKLETEKQVETEKQQKAKKLYLRIKMRSERLQMEKKLDNINNEQANDRKTKVSRVFHRPKTASSKKDKVVIAKKSDNGTTIIEPFSFAIDKRIAPEQKNSSVKIETTAEIAMNFLHNTRSNGAPKNAAKKVTLPISPKLQTKRRGDYASATHQKTYEERIDDEMKEIKEHPFKAKAINKRIFESNGELGVPKVEAKKTTEPIAFNLRLDLRQKSRNDRELIDAKKEEVSQFKARPIPVFVLDRSKAPQLPIPSSKANFKPTIAHSPKLHGGKSASLAPDRRQRERFSKASLSNMSSTIIKSSHQQLKLTEPKEFRLTTAARGEYYRQQLQQQITDKEKKLLAATVIHATPMPKFSKKGFQPDLISSKASVTELKPFNLRSTVRHADAVQAFKNEVSTIDSKLANQTVFHALKVPTTTYKAENVTNPELLPKHELLVPLEIKLETDKRASKRREFDLQMEQKLSQVEAMQEVLAKQKLDMENRRIKEMRTKSIEEGGMSFKAQPILTKDLFPTSQPATVTLTTPFSPQLRTKARSSFRNSANSIIEKCSENNQTTKVSKKIHSSNQNSFNNMKLVEALQTL